jgi:hypothetical protein
LFALPDLERVEVQEFLTLSLLLLFFFNVLLHLLGTGKASVLTTET